MNTDSWQVGAYPAQSQARQAANQWVVERFNGRVAHLLKTTRFAHADEMIEPLEKYQTIYNHHLIQHNLGHIIPVQTLKTWYKEKSDLFNKQVSTDN